MRTAARAGFGGCLGLALLYASAPAHAASYNCSARNLSVAAAAICRDVQLSRADLQTARRVDGFTRRLTIGQYLGLRYWQSTWREQRDRCGSDRACLAGSYRRLNSFLDRLQQCLDAGFQRRQCLRNTLNIEREALRR